MNWKEKQPLAVTMETGQAKHPYAKVNVSRMQMASPIGHFRVPLFLCFKTSLSAKPFK